MQALPIVPIDDLVFAEDSDDSEGIEEKQCDSDNDIDGLLDDKTREFQMLVNSFDDDINVGTVHYKLFRELRI